MWRFQIQHVSKEETEILDNRVDDKNQNRNFGAIEMTEVKCCPVKQQNSETMGHTQTMIQFFH